MLSPNTEQSLHRALDHANRRRHEFATLEHLLLALTEDEDALDVFGRCEVPVSELAQELEGYLNEEIPCQPDDATAEDAQPSASFQRVLQRAAIRVQALAKDEVAAPDVLAAMLAEDMSHALYFLKQHGFTADKINALGLGEPAPAPPPASPLVPDERPILDPSPQVDDAVHLPQSHELAQTLHRATGFALKYRHPAITPDHLLAALMDDQDAQPALYACKTDLNSLSEALTTWLETDPAAADASMQEGPAPSAEHQRLLQHATITARCLAHEAVTGLHLLAALAAEPQIKAASLLSQHGLSRPKLATWLVTGKA